MELNQNNFLRWKGEFKKAPYTANAVNDSINMIIDQTFIEISPLINDVSTYGIALNTFTFTSQDNPDKPAIFNPSTSKVTYFLPVSAAVGNVRHLKYKWTDYNGNESNEATISINVIVRPTGWRVYPPSFSCEFDVEAERTGRSLYAQLVKYYLDNNQNVTPLTLKNNVVGDPNYVAPVEDPINCSTTPFVAWELTYGSGGYISCSVSEGESQTLYTAQDDTELSVGVYLYSNSLLTIPAPDGYYSLDFGFTHHVSSGIIVNKVTCSHFPPI